MSLPEKPNPNNPVVFFDIAVGSTVSCVNVPVRANTQKTAKDDERQRNT